MNFFSILSHILVVIAYCGCSSEKDSSERARVQLKDLKENQARVSFTVANNEFYKKENHFSGNVRVDRSALSITLSDPEGARTIINFGGDKWFRKKPLRTAIFENGEAVASVKIGKVVDPEKMIGEGFMLVDGEIAILEFSLDKMIIEIIGKAGRYSDFQQPDTLFPIKGFIVYKKPAFSFGDLTEKDLFGSTSSN